MKSRIVTRKKAVALEDLRAEDRFSASLASLATLLITRGKTPSEGRRGNDRLERQPDGESAA
ncbi:MAG: hypothetical protein KJZ70_15750 [Bryobacterales bacterium]|nr:hypothetical protein [Bryobacterales bacterium]